MLFLGSWYTDTRTIRLTSSPVILTSSPVTLTLASQIRKEFLVVTKVFTSLTCSLYSQRANHMISRKVAEFDKLIKRIRYLQEWLKTSDIWRDYHLWKWELFEPFSKVQILMFLRERTLKK
jgi:hypothetical protein